MQDTVSRKRLCAFAIAIAASALPACGTTEDAPPGSSAALRGRYVPKDPTTTQAIDAISFDDDRHYRLMRDHCADVACEEHGSYSVDAAKGLLVLVDDRGVTTPVPFEVVATQTSTVTSAKPMFTPPTQNQTESETESETESDGDGTKLIEEVGVPLLVALEVKLFGTAFSSSMIIGGEETDFWPAVGVFMKGESFGCSGTLVAANVALTARHCMDQSVDATPGYDFVIVKKGKRYRFPTGKGWVLHNTKPYNVPDRDDIALVRLTKSVPSTVAKPMTLASSWPPSGEPMQTIGFGCTGWGTNTGGVKRRVHFKWGENKQSLCPGDSGGGTIRPGTGEVVGVNSGGGAGQDDIFGWIPENYAEVAAALKNM